MNLKYILSALTVWLCALAYTSCADGCVDTVISPQPPIESTLQDTDGIRLILNCDKPGFDGDASRAHGDWAEGDIIYMVLDNDFGGAVVAAARVGDSWTFSLISGLLVRGVTEQHVDAVYLENALSLTDTRVIMDYSSIPYYGAGLYSMVDESIDIYVALSPLVTRLKFAGESGQSVMVAAKPNDLIYPEKFDISTFTMGFQYGSDFSLNINSDGFTDYIYTRPRYEGNNRIAIVMADGTRYTRKIDSAELGNGRSGILRLPASDNLYGWQPLQEEPEHVYDWRSLGFVRYDEPFFCGGLFKDFSATSYKVEIQEDANAPGLYRLVAPYGDAASFFMDPYTDKGNDHHLIIDATDPDYVYIPYQYTGLQVGNARYYVCDNVGDLMYQGYDLDLIKINDIPFGKKVGNTITFETEMLTTYIDDKPYPANFNGPFVLTLPGSDDDQGSQFDREDFDPDIDLGQVKPNRLPSLPANLSPRAKTIKLSRL